jgi:hypothetical protein
MKGDITISVIISGLFAIGIVTLSVYLSLKFSQIIRVSNAQAQTERDAVFLANAIASHEKLIYEKDGIRYRGVLNASKLDSTFKKFNNGIGQNEFLTLINPTNWITFDVFDLSYPDSLSLILIIDLDECNEENCIVWGGSTVSITSGILLNSPFYNFGECMYQTFESRVLRKCEIGGAFGKAVSWLGNSGEIIGKAIGCAAGIFSLFSNRGLNYDVNLPYDILYCAVENIPEPVKLVLQSGNLISQRGIPVNIIHDDGRIHKGRITVSLLELM